MIRVRTRYQVDRALADRALKSGALTPGHAAAEGAVDAAGEDLDDVREAERRRDRIRHLAVPDAEPAEIPEVDVAELGKRYQGFDTPDGYPQMAQVDPEQFRRGPLTGDHAAYSVSQGTPGVPVPIPSPPPSAAVISRPLLTDGQSRPCAPEAC